MSGVFHTLLVNIKYLTKIIKWSIQQLILPFQRLMSTKHNILPTAIFEVLILHQTATIFPDCLCINTSVKYYAYRFPLLFHKENIGYQGQI